MLASDYDKRVMNLGGLSEQTKGIPLCSATNGIVATPGGTQATGVPLTSVINRVTVCATIGDAVVLPQAQAGASLIVVNAGATSMNVFPFLGDQINALAANGAFAIAAGKTVEFFSANVGVWHSVLSA